jgi:serine/threonine-protein kinase
MENDIIKFVRTKDYKFLKDIGQGSTGKTVLLHDEIIDEKFVCKKYSTFFKEDQNLYFKNFIDEIKLLHLLYHENVIRVFNYYLYPELSTGYILMEYIEGDTIENYLQKNPEKINDIFTQTISGFLHLEQNGILHRDIRPENILLSNNGVSKIIDLGFGKKIDFKEDFDNSISLNWRYAKPKDFEDKIYNYTTEVYFVGKLFEEIIIQNNIQNFSFSSALNGMINHDFHERTKSFFEVYRKVINGEAISIKFSPDEKNAYQNFANSISPFLTKIEESTRYQTNIDQIINGLEKIYMNSMLEDYVQNLNSLAREFLKGDYFFNRNASMKVEDLHNFYQMLKSISRSKRRVVLNNLWSRLDTIMRYDNSVINDDDLPF